MGVIGYKHAVRIIFPKVHLPVFAKRGKVVLSEMWNLIFLWEVVTLILELILIKPYCGTLQI